MSSPQLVLELSGRPPLASLLWLPVCGKVTEPGTSGQLGVGVISGEVPVAGMCGEGAALGSTLGSVQVPDVADVLLDTRPTGPPSYRVHAPAAGASPG